MPRLSISDLEKPCTRYRVDLASETDFESPLKAREEDQKRAKLLSSAARLFPALRRRAFKLATKLRGTPVPNTLASKRRMRRYRKRVAGAIWQLVDETGVRHVNFFTVVLSDWAVHADELGDFDPRRITEPFRQVLYRNGARDASGWLIAFVDVDFNPDTCMFQLHLHGLASSGMVRVLERVRKLPRFRSIRGRGLVEGEVSVKLQIKRKPLSNLPHLVTYLVKSGHHQVVTVDTATPGSPQSPRFRRRPRPGRIPEPYHSQLLLWLDKQGLSDLALMVGLSVTRRGLTPTKLPTIRTRMKG